MLLSVLRNRMNTNRARTLFFQITPVDLEKKVKNTWVKNINSAKKIRMDSEGHHPVIPAPCYRRPCFRIFSGKFLMITPVDT